MQRVIITESLTNWGGQQKKVYYEIESILSLGFDPVLICNRGAVISDRVNKMGVDVYEKEISKKKVIALAIDILQLSNQIGSDLIISHGSTDSWAALIAKILSFGRIRVYREKHNIYEIRGVLSKLVYRKLYNKVLVVSEAIRDYMLDIGCTKEKLYLLPDAVDVDVFAPNQQKRELFRSNYSIVNEDKVVGVVTTLKKEKGLRDLIEACTISVNEMEAYFVFGGRISGENKKYVLSELENKSVDLNKVIFTGFVSDPEDVYNGLDLFVHLSHSEGMGTVIIEAMSVGLPVVVWDRRPMSDIVCDAVNGKVVSFGAYEKLSDSINYIFECYGSGIYNVNREKVINNYSVENLQERLRCLI